MQSYGLAAHAVENLLVSLVAQEQRSRVVLVTQVEETWQSERLPAKIALWLFNGRSVDRAGGCAATDAPLIASLPTGAPSGLDLDPSIAPKGRFALVPFSLRDALPPTAKCPPIRSLSRVEVCRSELGVERRPCDSVLAQACRRRLGCAV